MHVCVALIAASLFVHAMSCMATPLTDSTSHANPANIIPCIPHVMFTLVRMCGLQGVQSCRVMPCHVHTIPIISLHAEPVAIRINSQLHIGLCTCRTCMATLLSTPANPANINPSTPHAVFNARAQLWPPMCALMPCRAMPCHTQRKHVRLLRARAHSA